MLEIVLRVATKRFFEMLITSGALSTAVTALFIFNALPSRTVYIFACLTFSALAFLVINIGMFRNCYLDMEGDKTYYLSNYLAYFIFMLAGFLTYEISNEAYTWLFAITKFVRFSYLSASKSVSAVIFHAIMLLTVLTSPIGLGWVRNVGKTENAEENEFV